MRESYRPLVELTRARLLEFTRDPAALFWVFGFPVVLAVVLGIAFRNKPPDALRVAVEAAAAETPWGQALASDGIERLILPREEAATALRTGRVDLWLEAAAPSEGKPSFVLHYDPLRPEGRAARMAVDAAVQTALGRGDVAVMGVETEREVGSRYIDFLVPGLIGMNLMGSSMWGMGYAVVDARKRKLLKRFAATPMVRAHFLLSYVASRLVFLAIEVVFLLTFAALVFDVAIAGSLATVMGVALLGSLSFAGVALLIAARPQSTEVASGWMNFVMMPMWLASGSFFSYQRFPDVLQPFIRALPLTALNDALRAVMNDGLGWASPTVWGPCAVLVAWGLVCFGVALRWFRWM